jgi:hypothetical protein
MRTDEIVMTYADARTWRADDVVIVKYSVVGNRRPLTWILQRISSIVQLQEVVIAGGMSVSRPACHDVIQDVAWLRGPAD